LVQEKSSRKMTTSCIALLMALVSRTISGAARRSCSCKPKWECENQAEGAGRLVNAVACRRFAADLDLPRLQAQDLLPARRCREPWPKDRRRRFLDASSTWFSAVHISAAIRPPRIRMAAIRRHAAASPFLLSDGGRPRPADIGIAGLEEPTLAMDFPRQADARAATD
jgi:hypothetical protein